jgi:hypothetical protein
MKESDMNTIYYFITRKIIRQLFIKIQVAYRSLFYILCIIALTWPVAFFIENDPTVKGILAILWLILLAVGIVIRIFLLCCDKDWDDEPLFVQRFIEDCCRSNNEMEKKFKEAREELKQRKAEEKAKKKEIAERIDYRSDILDL